MLLYAESLCTTASVATTRASLGHALGGLALGALAGAHPWVAAVAWLLLELALALSYARHPDIVRRVATGAFCAAGAGAGLVLHWLYAPAAREPLRPLRVVCVLALWLVAAWRLDDVLCVERTPVGLARSLVLWLGAVLLDAHAWGVGQRLVRAHVASGLWLYAHYAVEYGAASWLRGAAALASLGVGVGAHWWLSERAGRGNAMKQL